MFEIKSDELINPEKTDQYHKRCHLFGSAFFVHENARTFNNRTADSIIAGKSVNQQFHINIKTQQLFYTLSVHSHKRSDNFTY
jgi:hypothetical protein